MYTLLISNVHYDRTATAFALVAGRPRSAANSAVLVCKHALRTQLFAVRHMNGCHLYICLTTIWLESLYSKVHRTRNSSSSCRA